MLTASLSMAPTLLELTKHSPADGKRPCEFAQNEPIFPACAAGGAGSYDKGMNKAFVREPEDTGQRNCPRCSSLGSAATAEAVRTHVTAEALANISDIAWFCPFPRCEVAYFDSFERLVTIDQLTQPVWPKDPEAPLCSCFGLTRDDIEDDIREGVVTRVRAVVEKAKTSAARCRQLAPDGHSCVGEVQRYYMKRRQER